MFNDNDITTYEWAVVYVLIYRLDIKLFMDINTYKWDIFGSVQYIESGLWITLYSRMLS